MREHRSDCHDDHIRVLFICQWFTPEPARIPKQIVSALQRDGFATRVLTGTPHYPSGRVAPGYSALDYKREVVDNVHVTRTPEYPNRSISAIRRMFNYLSWAVSAGVLSPTLLRRADVTLVYSSPATAGIPTLVGRFLFGTPYILLIQDLWPDSTFAKGLESRPLPLSRPAITWLCSLLYRYAAHILVISPRMVTALTRRGVPIKTVSLRYNWVADEGSQTSMEAVRTPDTCSRGSEARRLLYAGNHGRAQALGGMIQAVASRADVVLTLVGSVIDRPRLVGLAHSLGALNVHFHNEVAQDELHRFVQDADVEVVSLTDNRLFGITIPRKVQAIMTACKLILVIATGDVACLVEAADCGWTASPGEQQKLIEAIDQVVAAPVGDIIEHDATGRAYFDRHMSATKGRTHLTSVLQAVSNARKGMSSK